MNRLLLASLLLTASLLSVLFALSVGSAGSNPLDAWNSLLGNGDPALREIIIELLGE